MKKILLFSTLSLVSSFGYYSDSYYDFYDTQELNLDYGWNLVGFQKPIYNARATFAQKEFGYIDTIYMFDSNDGWIFYDQYKHSGEYRIAKRGLQDFNISSSKGVWIKANKQDTLNFKHQNISNISNRSDELSIKNSWNLLSLSSNTVLHPKFFEEYEIVWKFTNNQWEKFDKTTKDIKFIDEKDGFWVKSNVENRHLINDDESKMFYFEPKSEMDKYIKSVINKKPNIYIEYSLNEPNKSASFNALANDEDGNIVSYYWDFGDESTSHESNPTKIYTKGGTYKVSCKVTDDSGASNTNYAYVYIKSLSSSSQIASSAAYSSLGAYSSVGYSSSSSSYPSIPPAGSSSSATQMELSVEDATTTNIQEKDVDEVDIIKISGDKFFILNKSKNRVVVYNAIDLINNKFEAIDSITTNYSNFYIDSIYVNNGILYTLSATTDKSKILLQLFDTKDKAKEINRFIIDGELKDTRLLKDKNKIYLITKFIPYVEQKNLIYPKIEKIDGSVKELFESKNLYAPLKLNQKNPSIITVTVIDLNSSLSNSVSIIGDTYTQYMSSDALYLVSHAYPASYSYLDKLPRSAIYKFDINNLETNGSIKYIDNIFVYGETLNQFSLSELNNTIRVATFLEDAKDKNGEKNNLWSEKTFIYSIADEDGILKTKSSLEYDSKLSAVRFFNNKAFLNTKTAGTFYTIDLKDYANIKKSGELNSSSTALYFHQIDTNHLLSFGREIIKKDKSVEDILLQAIDVTNIYAPKILHSYANWSVLHKSEVEQDHKAFTMRLSDKIFALPIYDESLSSLYVLKVDNNYTILPISKIDSDTISKVDNRSVIFDYRFKDTNSTKSFVVYVYEGNIKIKEINK